MRQGRIQARVLIEMTHRLCMIHRRVKGGFQDERIGRRFGCHRLIVSTVPTQELETTVCLVLQE